MPPTAPPQVPPRPAAHTGTFPAVCLLEEWEIQGCDGLRPLAPNSKTQPVQARHRHPSPQPVACLHQQHFLGLIQNLRGGGCAPWPGRLVVLGPNQAALPPRVRSRQWIAASSSCPLPSPPPRLGPVSSASGDCGRSPVNVKYSVIFGLLRAFVQTGWL